MKKIILPVLTVMLLMLPLLGYGEAWDEVIGQTAQDFELTCADGSRFCLSEALEEKKLAVICVFGSGCRACQKEMQALSLAYQLYQDRVAAVGLSLDRSRDTDEELTQFASDHGVVFPLGMDPVRTARFMQINMYPAFMIVNPDREVLYIEVNGEGTIDHFIALFDRYLDSDPDRSDACAQTGCPIPKEALGVSWTGLEWNGDIEAGNNDIVSIGREPARVDSIPYDTLEAAIQGAEEYRKELSPHYLLLSQQDWKFAYFDSPADFEASAVTDFYQLDFDDTDWDAIFVPSVWQTEGYDHPIYTNTTQKFAKQFGNEGIGYPRDLPKAPTVYNPIGLYRYGFELPEDWTGKRVYIDFEGVDAAMYLWVNGVQAGYAEDSFTTHEFDITDYVHTGRQNLIAVQVFRWCDGSWIEDQDMFDLSGIFRDVYVYATPQVRVRDFSIVTDFDDTFTDSILNVAANVHNYTNQPQNAAVGLRLFDAEGKEIALDPAVMSVEIGPGSEQALSFSVPVSAPRQWSAEDPYLYTLVLVEETETGTVYEGYQVGFRKITYKTTLSGWYEDSPTDHDLIRINGKPISFRGVDRHETHPEYGYAITREVMERDIQIMLENNINSVRTSHYPNNPYWYYLCDKYGIYVVDEANFECHSNMTTENERLTDYLSIAIIDREYSMVRRDRNHPSVVMWSLGNENKNPIITRTILVDEYPDPEGVERVLHVYTKDRPWHYEQARDMYETGIDVRSGMYALPDELIAYGEADSVVPMIECEYEHAMGNSEGNFDEYWTAYDTYRNLQGGFIWDFIDQSIYLTNEEGKRYFGYGGDYGERVHDSNFCANGLLLPDRTVQPEMAEVKYHYQQIKFENLDADHGIVRVKNFYLFTDIPDKYEIHWALKRNDTVLASGVVEEEQLHIASVDAETNQPGAGEIRIPFSLTKEDLVANSEYFLDITVVLKEDSGLLKAGHIAAIEQFQITPETEAPGMEHPELPPLTVARNNGETRIWGEGFDVSFDDASGKMTRYTADDMALILPDEGPAPNFFRAGTDNDRGFGYGLFVFTRPWKETGEYQISTFRVDDSQAGKAVVTVEGVYPELNGLIMNTEYTVYGDGAVAVRETIIPQYDQTFVYIPVAGVQLTVPGNFEQMTFFGRGPEENYIDRANGTKVGVWETTVTDNFFPYVKSSETGNRTGVRWIALQNETGFGLLATAGDAPMEISALHYTAMELDRGVHPYELEKLSDTLLRLNAVQIGVGGDNAWSRIVPHEQYLPHEEVYHYSFILSPIRPDEDAMERSLVLRSR